MTKATIARTITSVIVAINSCLVMFGADIGGVTEDVVYQVVSVVVMIVAWAVSFYKNNDFSEEACEGTGLTRLLKAAKKATEEVTGENFFDEIEEDTDTEEGEE